MIVYQILQLGDKTDNIIDILVFSAVIELVHSFIEITLKIELAGLDGFAHDIIWVDARSWHEPYNSQLLAE